MSRFDKPLNRGMILALAMPLLAATAQGCFKDEPLNAECDIEEAHLDVSDTGAWFFNPTDAHVRVASDATQVVFDVRQSADLSALAPTFVLSAGATISPASGSVHDFSNGTVSYTVTSEDGAWQRTYSVAMRRTVRSTSEVVDHTFEYFYLDPGEKYYCWTDFDEAGTALNNWATANAGYMLARGSAAPDDYPTTPCEGVDGGTGVKLTTLSTGAFGAMVNRPLAAGNIFIGSFDISKALSETLKATRFGLPLAMKPLKLKGYYRYKAGDVYTDSQGKEVAGRRDSGTIHASYYKNHDSTGAPIVLYGDNVQSSSQIVAKLKMVIDSDTDGWTYFEADFEYLQEVDTALLDSNGYSLTVVGSSSVDGDLYSGAVGSTLCIDNLQVVCEKIED